MPVYLAVAVGGAFGAVARFGIVYAAGSVLSGILAVYAGTLVGRTL
jgi:fluoride ion exporter CrcB/FEX